MAKTKSKQMMKVLTGNQAVAWGTKLSRPAVISVYPITPQSEAAEVLTDFVARGELDAEVVEAEGEHSVLSILHGAALSGSRTFTCSSNVGLFFMFEMYTRTSTLRLPIVIPIANREMMSPGTVSGGQSDSFVVREAGWIQLYVEDCQEILDTVIMAYKIAEHDDVRLPINVCYDGWYLSFLTEPVLIPDQKDVDNFLPPYHTYAIFDPERPMMHDGWTPSGLFTKHRISHCEGMEAAKRVINEVDREYGEMFGRSYGGLLEEYRMEGADMVLITVGSSTGTARVIIDRMRDTENMKIGLVKLRCIRPFPRKEICRILDGRTVVGVVDRQVGFGWNSGEVLWELRSALYDAKDKPMCIGFIDGLAGGDITKEHLEQMVRLVADKANGKDVPEVTWFGTDVP